MPRPVEDNLLRLPRSSKLVAPEKALNLQDPLLLQIDSGGVRGLELGRGCIQMAGAGQA